MKKNIFSSIAVAVLVLLSFPVTGRSASPVKVEILYMNHGPLRPTVEQIKQILLGYREKVSRLGTILKAKRGKSSWPKRISSSISPWSSGSMENQRFQVEGKDVQLMGFPSGSGPAAFQGKWTMDDLRKALDQLTGKK